MPRVDLYYLHGFESGRTDRYVPDESTGTISKLGWITTLTCCCIGLLIGGCRSEPSPLSNEKIRSDMFDVQGHRGARGRLPENTLAAFQYAMEVGVVTLEMDVVVSADDYVVVSHDPTFNATICSHPDGSPVTEDEQELLILYKMPYETIRRYDCGARGHGQFPTQQAIPAFKPLLSDVFELGEKGSLEPGREPIRYNIEIKSTPEGDGSLHPVPELFSRLVLDVVQASDVTSRTTLQSFDPRVLNSLRMMNAETDLSLLIGTSDDRGLAANLELLGFTPDIYSPAYSLVNDDLVNAVHSRGMTLIPWTVNTVEDMFRLRDMGVDGLITDFPDLAVDSLSGPD